jgi:hypothetical protein
MRKAKKKADTNVVPFVPPAADEELGMNDFSDVKPGYDEIVEMLVAMDDVEYDRCRHAKAIEWDLCFCHCLLIMFLMGQRSKAQHADPLMHS